MARLFWVAVGAAGGVYAYRKGERAAAAVRQRGVAGTAQVLAAGAFQALARTGDAAEGPGVTVGGLRISKAVPAPTPQIVDTEVVDIRDLRGGQTRPVLRRKAT